MKQLKWTTVVEYYDITTGLQIDNQTAKQNYTTINSDKTYEFGPDASNPLWGKITIYKQARLNDQLRLPFDTTGTLPKQPHTNHRTKNRR